MLVSTLAAWASWILVVFKIDPFGAGGLAFLLFYCSLGLAMTGTVTLLGLTLRLFFQPKEVFFRHVSDAFRKAAFLSFLIIALLYSQTHSLLTWWNVLLLILAVVLLEVFWLTYRVRRR